MTLTLPWASLDHIARRSEAERANGLLGEERIGAEGQPRLRAGFGPSCFFADARDMRAARRLRSALVSSVKPKEGDMDREPRRRPTDAARAAGASAPHDSDEMPAVDESGRAELELAMRDELDDERLRVLASTGC